MNGERSLNERLERVGMCLASLEWRRRSAGGPHLMTDARRFEKLRATYRSRWDAHQIIADHNARLVQAGKQPTNEQLINEQRAAEAVELARNDLLAAMTRVGA